jgi:hypothetical protein
MVDEGGIVEKADCCWEEVFLWDDGVVVAWWRVEAVTVERLQRACC